MYIHGFHDSMSAGTTIMQYVRLATFVALLIAYVNATLAQDADRAAAVAGPEWNQFRGPNGTGIATEYSSTTPFDANTPTWKVAVPPGLSSPVLTEHNVIVTAVENGRLVTFAFDRRNGNLVWKQAAPELPLEPVHPTSSPAASTPCADERHIYVYFGSFGLLCYKHDGTELWRRELSVPSSLYGASASPIVIGEQVIMVLDDDASLSDSSLSQSRMFAIDRNSGATLWETPRPWHRSGWSTPTLWGRGEQSQIIVLGSGRLCGYDLATGVEKWHVNGFSRETVTRPIVDQEYVYAAAAMLGGVADEQPDPEPFWAAMLTFDTNADDKLQRSEMTDTFTLPFRPSLPVTHPGFGLPLPSDVDARKKRQNQIFSMVDKDNDGIWTKAEFIDNLRFDRGKPLLVAVRPGGEGDVTESHVAWNLHRGIPEVPTPILFEKRIYLVSDGGIVTLVDSTNGKVIYRERLGVAGHYRASPVIANRQLYAISESGVLSIIQTGDEFGLVSQHDFHESVAATPAFDRDTMYVRTANQLVALRNAE